MSHRLLSFFSSLTMRNVFHQLGFITVPPFSMHLLPAFKSVLFKTEVRMGITFCLLSDLKTRLFPGNVRIPQHKQNDSVSKTASIVHMYSRVRGSNACVASFSHALNLHPMHELLNSMSPDTFPAHPIIRGGVWLARLSVHYLKLEVVTLLAHKVCRTQ